MGNQLKDTLKQIFLDVEATNNTAERKAELMADAVIEKLKITIPIGEVIVEVTGGSGSPAVGIPNSSPIELDVESR